MNDINELIRIIQLYQGSATTDEIIKQYVKDHPMWILPEHRAMIEQTLREHPGLVTYDEKDEIWDLVVEKQSGETKEKNRADVPLEEKLTKLDNNLQGLIQILRSKVGEELSYTLDSNDSVMKIKRTGERKNLVGITYLSREDCFKLWSMKGEPGNLASKVGPLRKEYILGEPGNKPTNLWQDGYRVKSVEQCAEEVLFWMHFSE